MIGAHYSTKTDTGALVYNFRDIFLWPSGVALVAAIALFLFFHPPRDGASNHS